MARSRKTTTTTETEAKPKSKPRRKGQRTCKVTDIGREARRRNASLAAAARSPEGTARSSINALRDGCYSETDILATESPERFQARVDRYIVKLGAVTELECDAALDAARYSWRRDRCIHADNNALEKQIARAQEGQQ